MDARLDPANYAGLAKGGAHVIRNAGGSVGAVGCARRLSDSYRQKIGEELKRVAVKVSHGNPVLQRLRNLMRLL